MNFTVKNTDWLSVKKRIDTDSRSFSKKRIPSLENSIQKWKFIVQYLEEHPDEEPVYDNSDKTCNCCKVYLYSSSIERCRSCPIKQFTGKRLCNGTPYMDYYTASVNRHNYKSALKAAKEEVEFLEKVLKHELAKKEGKNVRNP